MQQMLCLDILSCTIMYKHSEASTQQPTVTMCTCQHPVQPTTQAVPAQYIAVNTAEASDLCEI